MTSDKALNDAIIDNIKFEMENLENAYNNSSISSLQKARVKLTLTILKEVCKPRLCCPYKDRLSNSCFNDCSKCKALHKEYPNIDFTKVNELTMYYD